MKKRILVILTFLSISSAFAQTDKGQKFIGGQLNFNGNTTAFYHDFNIINYRKFSFNVIPSFGYFVKNNLAIGATIKVGYSKSSERLVDNINDDPLSIFNTDMNSISITKNYGIGSFVRYYWDLSKRFKFYLQGGLNYTYGIQQGKSYTSDPSNPTPGVPVEQNNRLNTANIDVSPGLVFFTKPNLAIQTSIGRVYYQFTKSQSKLLASSHSTLAEYGANLKLTSFYFGINYHF